MGRTRRDKRCRKVKKKRAGQIRRSPSSPGASLVGAPRTNRSQREVRTKIKSTSDFVRRLRSDPSTYVTILLGLIRLWTVLPHALTEHILRLLNLH